MNKHVLGDRLLLMAAHLLGKPFFRESIEGPGFDEHLAAIEISAETPASEGYYPAVAMTLDGEHHAGFKVLHWRGAEAATIFFNQGGAERPVDRILSKIYPPDEKTPFNIVAIQASCQSSTKELNERFASLSTYTAMVAFAVKLTEWLIQCSAFRSAAATAVTGYSLGGFVTGRHHLIFNSADVYIPFVAGTRHAEIFLTTIRAGANARAHPEVLRDRLNFYDDWIKQNHPNVFPVLGRYDQLNQIEVQKPSYGDMPVQVWEGGHLHGARHPEKMRPAIEAPLKEALLKKAKADPDDIRG